VRGFHPVSSLVYTSTVCQQIQYAAKTTLQVNFNATYSGTYVHFHAYALETEV